MAARVITTLGELDAEAERWGALDEQAVAPTQRFAWIRACAAGFAEELRFVLVERGRELAAVAPLALQAGALELVGARELYEPADFAYLDEPALGSLATELRRLKERFVVPRMPATSPTVAALRRAFRGRGALLVRSAGATPVVVLGAGDPLERFTSRRKGDLRRAERRAEQQGTVAVDVRAPAEAEVLAVLEEFYEVEA
ncbi:MAG TPA: hypothetical protein VH420_08585, partial [Gaiellaceae bacterium]